MNKVLAENLYTALKKVKITQMSNLPILNTAKLNFVGGRLVVTTTNIDKVFQENVSCILEDEWSTCVPMVTKVDISNTYKPKGHKFYPFLDFCKISAECHDVLLFSLDKSFQILEICIQGERSKTQFKCIDSMEFPQ